MLHISTCLLDVKVTLEQGIPLFLVQLIRPLWFPLVFGKRTDSFPFDVPADYLEEDTAKMFQDNKRPHYIYARTGEYISKLKNYVKAKSLQCKLGSAKRCQGMSSALGRRLVNPSGGSQILPRLTKHNGESEQDFTA
jgi:hypothetical protein